MRKISLMGMLLLFVLITIYSNANIYAAAPTALEEVKGVWLWGSTVRQMGQDGVVNVIKDLKDYGFTDILLLVKGESGVVGYPSKVAFSAVKTDRDYLKDLIAEAHKNKLRVHAWFVINSDASWGTQHPEDLMVHLKSGPAKGKISPLSPGYQKYIKDMVQEVIDNYDIDGIHLDYIRYSHALYSFDKYVLDEVKKRKIDIEKVKNILTQSTPSQLLYDPNDNPAVIKAYQAGDPTIVAWAKLRRDIITNYAKNIKKVVRRSKRPLYFSASLRPDAAIDPAYGVLYFGQDYKDAASLYDFVVPMSYWKDFYSPPQWVGTVVKQGVALLEKTPIMAGLQAYDIPGNRQMEEAEAAAKANGSSGVFYFRYGTFVFAAVHAQNGADGKSLVSFELENRSESAIDTIEIDFRGSGLLPKTVGVTPNGAKTQVNNTLLSLTGEKLLDLGKTITFSVEVEKDSITKDFSPMPSINVSLQQKIFVPVFAMMK